MTEILRNSYDGDLDAQYNSNAPQHNSNGNAKKYSQTTTDYSYVYWVLLIIVLIVVIYVFSTSGKDSNRELANKYYNNLHGDANDETAKKAIEHGKKISNPTAMDSYHLGSTYLINAQNPYEANKHFTAALQKIIDGNTNPTDAMFIVERIDEFKDRFVDYPDLTDLPLQHALLATFDVQNKKAVADNGNKKDSVEKKLLDRQHWHSESQNVHDSTMYKVLKDQIYKVRELNAKIPDIESKNYVYISNWLRMRYCDDSEKSKKIDQVLRILDNNYPTRLIPNINEQDIFVAAWRRSQDPNNATRMSQMYDAFGDAILDCVEGEHVVCIDGRIAKIWQSLALLDGDKDMGVLRSKQMLRNEIYERCSKAVGERLANASEEVRQAYNRPKNNTYSQLRDDAQANEDGMISDLIENMRHDMDVIGAEYAGRLDADVLNGIINECKMVV